MPEMNSSLAKIITWANNSNTVIIWDTFTKKQEWFKVDTTIPNFTDGSMIGDKLYVMGGYGPVNNTYEIDAAKR